jgi:SAM-dependent MidA family methyltransferase
MRQLVSMQQRTHQFTSARPFAFARQFASAAAALEFDSRLYGCRLPLTRPPELLRDFIHDALYNPEHGYFSRKHTPILTQDTPLNEGVAQMSGQNAYNRALKQLYAQKSLSRDEPFAPLWHTPSELFRPHYGRAVVRRLLQSHAPDEHLVIYELGPGNGGLAESILEYLSVAYPEVFARCEYHCIEISAGLRDAQKKRLERFGNAVRFHGSLEDGDTDGLFDDRPCWVVACEVLDNLPHDLIKYEAGTGHLLEGIVLTNAEASILSAPGRNWIEFRPLGDRLILELVQLLDAQNYASASLRGSPWKRLLERLSPIPYLNPRACEFVPTGALRLLKTLLRRLPRHGVLFADFHALTDVIPFGCNAPVVQTTYRGVPVACSTLLLARGHFDIFFPTNFGILSRLYSQLSPSTAAACATASQGDFLMRFCQEEEIDATTTASGYNPMLHDFENVTVFTREPNKHCR